MEEPIYSPDGQFMWTGNKWIPVMHEKPIEMELGKLLDELSDEKNLNGQSSNITDSVVIGNVKSKSNNMENLNNVGGVNVNSSMLSVTDSVVMGNIIQNIEQKSDPKLIERIMKQRQFEQLSSQLFQKINKRNWDDSKSLVQQIFSSFPSVFSVQPLSPRDTYLYAKQLIDGKLKFNMEQDIEIQNTRVKNLRILLEAKRIQTITILFIKGKFKNERKNNDFGRQVILHSGSQPNFYQEWALSEYEFERCIESIIEELKIIYELKKIIDPKYDGIKQESNYCFIPYFEADVIRLRMAAVSESVFPNQYKINSFENHCIPLFNSLHSEGKLVRDGIANFHCKDAYVELRKAVQKFGFSTRLFISFTLIGLPTLLFIWQWAFISPNSNYRGIIGVLSGFLFLCQSFFVIFNLPFHYKYFKLRKWCKSFSNLLEQTRPIV